MTCHTVCVPHEDTVVRIQASRPRRSGSGTLFRALAASRPRVFPPKHLSFSQVGDDVIVHLPLGDVADWEFRRLAFFPKDAARCALFKHQSGGTEGQSWRLYMRMRGRCHPHSLTD